MEELWQEVSDELSRLRSRVQRLSSLIEVGAIISSSLDLDEVLHLVMAKARSVMETETCSVLLLNDETNELEFTVTLGNNDETKETLQTIRLKMGQGVAGWCAENRQTVVIDDASQDTRFFAGVDDQTGFVTRSLIAVPLIHQDRLIGVAEVINPLEKNGFDQDDIELFETFCRQVAIAIDNARFHQAYLAQQRLREQLQVAATIQASFLPKASPDQTADGLRLNALTLPALEVGGDLYDYFLLPGPRLALFIGDVSGKGVGAALYMAKVVSEFRSLARTLADPAEVLGRLNRSLHASSRLGMFVTGVYFIIDLKHGTCCFANAGHVPSLVRRHATGLVDLIEGQAGPPMGVLEGTVYQNDFMELKPDDSLLLLTDGVVEAWNKSKAQFGYDKLIDLAMDNPPEESLIKAVVKRVLAWSEGLPPHDDLTLMNFTWPGPSQEHDHTPNLPVTVLGEPVSNNLELDVGLSPRMLSVVRDVTERMANLTGFDDAEANGLKLAVDEACTNVLRHAYGGDSTRRLRINFTIKENCLTIELHDFGLKFDPNDIPAPDPDGLKPGGLGISLIKTVMDEVVYTPSELQGNTWKLVKTKVGKGK